VSPTLAFGLLLVFAGVTGLSFGFYALLRGGRGQRGGGIGPISERGVHHVVAGIRMLLVGALSLAVGVYVVWSSL